MFKKMFLFFVLFSIVGSSLAVAADPNLVLWYTFDDDSDPCTQADSSGNGYNATVFGDPNWIAGYPGLGGKAIDLEPSQIGTGYINDYLSLPIGDLVSTLSDCTITFWSSWRSRGNGNWMRYFDFGTRGGTGQKYVFLCPRQGNTTGGLRFAITKTSNEAGAEQGFYSAQAPTGWHYITAVFKKHTTDANYAMILYVDSQQWATATSNIAPKDLGVTPNNWIGRSSWTGDADLDSTMDDFRIYNRALAQEELEPISRHVDAWLLSPRNGTMDANKPQTLTWRPGYATQAVGGHKVYVSTKWYEVNDMNITPIVTDTNSYTATYAQDTTYYWRVVEVNGATEYKTNTIWSFTIDAPARAPQPADGQGGINVWLQQLTWTPFPASAVTGQKLYFSEYKDAVDNEANVVNLGPTVNTYSLAAIADLLPFDYYQEWYWRVDTVIGSDVYENPTWKFTTAFPINFCDDFSKSWDYWRSYGSTAGTIWDGVVGNVNSITAMETDSNSGVLHVAWSGRWGSEGYYGSSWPQGILIYKEVDGPYLATVEVKNENGLHVFPHTSINGQRVGIMARLPNLTWGRYGNESETSGEDWVQALFYPTYNVGNNIENAGWYFRKTGDAGGGGNNSMRSRRNPAVLEMNGMNTGWPDNPANGLPNGSNRSGRWVQLDYKGHDSSIPNQPDDGKIGRFYARYSSDGYTWYAIQNFGANGYNDNNPILNHDPRVARINSVDYYSGRQCLYPNNRYGDMNGYVHQVGIAFGSDTAGAWADVDNFCIGRNLMAKATAPAPPSGTSIDIMRAQDLRWNAGDLANEQDVFITDVNERICRDATATRSGGVPVPPYRGNSTDGIYVGVGTPNTYGMYPRYSYDLANETLELGKTYYWRVDEVNTVTPKTWKGDVWSFTILGYSVIDNFESYVASGDVAQSGLRRVWIDGRVGVGAQDWTYGQPPVPQGSTGSYAQVNTDPCDGTTLAQPPIQASGSGSKSLKVYYDNDGAIDWLVSLLRENATRTYTAPKYSEVSAAVDDAARLYDESRYLYQEDQTSLGLKRDWSQYKVMKVSYFGDWISTKGSTSDRLYVGLSDSSTKAVVYCPDTNAMFSQGWHTWYIRMEDFNSALDMTDIARIYFGFGNPTSPVTGGRGDIFIDDIQLLAAAQCAPLSPANPQNTGVIGDWNYDCRVNASDLQILTRSWLTQGSGASILPDANLVVKLNTTGMTVGQSISAWANTAVGPVAAGGTFRDQNSLVTGKRPTVTMIEGVKAVLFDSNDFLVCDVNTPATLTGSRTQTSVTVGQPNGFTVVYKVWNESLQDEEIFQWAKRGTNQKCAAVGYGMPNYWEAASFWGSGGRDVAFDNYDPAPHQWHTIMQTYAGGTNGAYYVVTDGQINTNTTRTLDLWPNGYMALGGEYNEDPNTAKWKLTVAQQFTGAIAEIKVYNIFTNPVDYAMSVGGPPMNLTTGDVPEIINFKDIANLANRWMVENLMQ